MSNADGGEVVAVDVLASYTGPDGTSTVASCDLYEFSGEELTRITLLHGQGRASRLIPSPG